MDWTTVVVSLGGSFIVGLVSILGIILNQHFQNKKERKKEIKELFLQRPNLNISDVTEPYSFVREEKSDIGVFFTYDNFISDKYFSHIFEKMDCWECIDYDLRNDGQTEINEIYISTENKLTIYNIYSEDPRRGYSQSKSKSAVKIRRIIKPGEPISFKVCSWREGSAELKELRKEDFAWERTKNRTLNIWLVDNNGNWWKQVLYVPKAEIKTSSSSSEREYLLSFNTLCANQKSTKKLEEEFLKFIRS